MFKYQNKKTGKIVERKTKMSREEQAKGGYILVSWGSNMLIKSNKVIKK